MSQDDVYKLLKKQKIPISMEEISRKTKVGRSAISSNLRRLEKWGDVSVVMKKNGKAHNQLVSFFYVSGSKFINKGEFKLRWQM